MKKIKTFIALFSLVIFLNACSSVVEGLTGAKKKGSEEFLIKKKPSLVLPPNFGELPTPTIKGTKVLIDNDFNLEEIINNEKIINNQSGKNSNRSVENFILGKINEQ